MITNKLTKAAGVMDLIVKVCAGIFKALVIVTLIFAVLILIFGAQMFSQGSITVELGFVKLYLSDAYQDVTPLVKAYAIVSLLCGCVGSATLAFICSLLRQILAPMKEGRPFEKRVSADMRKIAWAVLIGGGINEVLKLIEQVFVIKALPLEQLFSSSVVASREYMFQLDGGFVLIFFVILFLSYIFSYGQSLQQEADETI